jgi:Starch synthase catalytic domain
MSVTAPGTDCAPLRSIDPPSEGPGEWRSAGTAQVGDPLEGMGRTTGRVSRVLYGAGGGRLHLRFGDAPPRFDRIIVDGGVAGRLVVDRTVRNLAIALRVDAVDFSVLIEEPGRPAERVPPTGTLHVDAPDPDLTRPLRVLIAAAECAPLAVSGQLAGTVADTVAAAAALGHDVVLAVPLHRGAQLGIEPGVRLAELQCASSGRVVVGRVLQGALPGLRVPALSVDAPAYFERDAPYGDADDGERYLAFCAMVEALLRATALAPDIVHGFEWQTAALLAALASTDKPPATVFSVSDGAPGYRVRAAALSGATVTEEGGGEVDLLELGREVATVVAPASPAGGLGALYGSALELARSRR